MSDNVDTIATACGKNVRCSFKNTRETANAINGKSIADATKYLNAVINHKRCVPFRKHRGGPGKPAQAKNESTTLGRWPEKSCKVLLNLLQNVENNAKERGLEPSSCKIIKAQVQRCRKMRRKTHRAHGRINPYMSSPCSIELQVAAITKASVPKSNKE